MTTIGGTGKPRARQNVSGPNNENGAGSVGGARVARGPDTLVLERIRDDVPAPVLRAQSTPDGHADVAEEDLVEVALADHRRNLSDLDAWEIHRDEQDEPDEDTRADADAGDDVEELSMAKTAKSTEMPDQPVFRTSGGREVYGGGGIAPDIEFEIREYSELERRLERDGLFFTFAVDYSTQHDIENQQEPGC